MPLRFHARKILLFSAKQLRQGLGSVPIMAQGRHLALQNDPNIARFVVEGTATNRQLGIGSYGSVEEV